MEATDTLSDDVPARLTDASVVAKSLPLLVVIVTTGLVWSSVTVIVSVLWFPAASVARTVIAFEPADSGIDAVQEPVPVALLKGPPLFDHCTVETTPGAVSVAVPASASGVAFVAKLTPPLVVIVTDGTEL